MKVLYRSGNFTVEFVADGEVGLFEQIADFEKSVFKGDEECGLCQSKSVFNVRELDSGEKYYEKKCTNTRCRAALPLHQNKDKVKKGGLYKRWEDKWEKYVPKPKEDDAEVFDKKAVATKKGGK